MSAIYAMIAISIGSIIGALMRYGLSITLNAFAPHIPMGTLASNLIAAYIVGAAIAYFNSVEFSPIWRLTFYKGSHVFGVWETSDALADVFRMPGRGKELMEFETVIIERLGAEFRL